MRRVVTELALVRRAVPVLQALQLYQANSFNFATVRHVVYQPPQHVSRIFDCSTFLEGGKAQIGLRVVVVILPIERAEDYQRRIGLALKILNRNIASSTFSLTVDFVSFTGIICR